ncbi:prenyltransferase/squalene oxidase repeat-containing protein [Shimazuella kribbensis]|uniref:prenyltransferase/squalene oxidase repeat-containing protein n=1 Tax=Shimazuella kribbensis TaxID=139808 RepID=UPI0003F5E3B9|nr:prenyltransferase/squalene oxidase repeat-containing protein [Shimazuella kribbensis]
MFLVADISSMKRIETMMDHLSSELIKKQDPDGKWSFCFESGIMTDAYMLLLMKALGKRPDHIEQMLIDRILAKQTQQGTWTSFPDEKQGNPSATVEATLALLYSDKCNATPQLEKAKQYLSTQNRLDQANPLTRTVLAIFGHYPWNNLSKLPIEFFLLPTWGPIHFFDFVGYARTHLAPIMLIQDRKFVITLPNYERVLKWMPQSSSHKRVSNRLKEKIYPFLPHKHLLKNIRQQATRWGEKFLLDRMEPDGTLYNCMTTTFLLIFALLALGYKKNHPIIEKAYRCLLQDYLCNLKNEGHIQESNSNVWDSGLTLHSLLEAGIDPNHPTIQSGKKYLLSKQQYLLGDWSLHNPGVAPGGWGFSDQNTINPDIDDTTVALRVLTPFYRDKAVQLAWNRGATWLLSMQNKDGGWPAFEKDTGKDWQSFLPNLGSKVWGDPSMADLTGRSLEFLGKYTTFNHQQASIDKARKWLEKNQKKDGSWFGRWGVSYIYGTWAALTGLAAIKVPREDPTIKKGIKWLKSVQHKDGGWGESCYSDQRMTYIKLPFSTPVQTAWALDALISFYDTPTAEMETGITRLLQLLEERGEEWKYPVGSGLAGEFYVYYHSYPYVWPLITLSHYYKKYKKIGKIQE